MDMDNSLITFDTSVDIDKTYTDAHMKKAFNQAAKLVGICITAYPHSDKYKNEQAVRDTVALWANQFADDDWRVVGLAIKKHIATNKWAPSIAEIREAMVDITRPDLIPVDTAFDLIARYVDISSRLDLPDPSTIFPPLVVEALVSMGGYRGFDNLRYIKYGKEQGRQGLDRIAFRDSYAPKLERARKEAMLPSQTIRQISEYQQNYSSDFVKQFEHAKSKLIELETAKKQIYEADYNIPMQ